MAKSACNQPGGRGVYLYGWKKEPVLKPAVVSSAEQINVVIKIRDKFKTITQVIKGQRKLFTVLATFSAVVVFAIIFWGNKADASDYMTGKAERGSVAV